MMYSCHYCDQLCKVEEGFCYCTNCHVNYSFALEEDGGELLTSFFRAVINRTKYNIFLHHDENRTVVNTVKLDNVLEIQGYPLTPENVVTKLSTYLPFI